LFGIVQRLKWKNKQLGFVTKNRSFSLEKELEDEARILKQE
jgi:hypothetical protein